jgi:aminoglycoside phosphotransferase (APT) family kinase protein
MKLHHGELDIDASLVRRLLAAQHPQWADLSLAAAPSTGTVNAIYRLGDDMYVRVPRVREWAADLDKEMRWLPRLVPRLPLAVPEPLAAGRPSPDFPLPWAVYRWLDGEPWPGAVANDGPDQTRAAVDLAGFVTALRGVEMSGAPRSSRDRPLSARDAEARGAIEQTRGLVDADAVTAAWEASLAGPAWDGRSVWTHGDLLPPNLLVARGRLHAVLDWGNAGAGDPALDVLPAWSTFDDTGREAFRRELSIDEPTWLRARGFALHQALMIIPYYRDSNPAFVAMALRTVDRVLADHAHAGTLDP